MMFDTGRLLHDVCYMTFDTWRFMRLISDVWCMTLINT